MVTLSGVECLFTSARVNCRHVSQVKRWLDVPLVPVHNSVQEADIDSEKLESSFGAAITFVARQRRMILETAAVDGISS